MSAFFEAADYLEESSKFGIGYTFEFEFNPFGSSFFCSCLGKGIGFCVFLLFLNCGFLRQEKKFMERDLFNQYVLLLRITLSLIEIIIKLT